MQIGEGDKVVVFRGPREGSVIVFRVDSLKVLGDGYNRRYRHRHISPVSDAAARAAHRTNNNTPATPVMTMMKTRYALSGILPAAKMPIAAPTAIAGIMMALKVRVPR